MRRPRRAAAAFVQVVNGCDDCPLRSEEAHSSGFYFCNHPDAPHDDEFHKAVNSLDNDAPMPEACPLREQDLTLRGGDR